jgi:hypothetical protein
VDGGKRSASSVESLMYPKVFRERRVKAGGAYGQAGDRGEDPIRVHEFFRAAQRLRTHDLALR